MTRSQINQTIKDAEAFVESFRFALPPFARWTPEQWQGKGRECDGIRAARLGWDVTDFGFGSFSGVGLVLFTLRNGLPNAAPGEKNYAEKLLISREDQICPTHYHHRKTEDIINRGGGILSMRLHNSAEDGSLCHSDVTISRDGVSVTVAAGTEIELSPGESVTLTPGLYHSFWAKRDCGAVLIGEVSQTNDDEEDNRFLDDVGRFPEIEEDEPPYRLLCREYPV
ncbi:MAG: D-lyxose/D-mannose family sugar isomerase [Oscillospiraceae bacterium]|jgi:D-lyxose ketol-isomerase|nr:D-lyxose/D-mannose family sugar isomerase [Oscillospiraceae bacterium]